MTPTAHILPGDLLHAEAVRQAIQTGLHLVITRDGKSALVPQVLPGMVPMHAVDKQLEAA